MVNNSGAPLKPGTPMNYADHFNHLRKIWCFKLCRDDSKMLSCEFLHPTIEWMELLKSGFFFLGDRRPEPRIPMHFRDTYTPSWLWSYVASNPAQVLWILDQREKRRLALLAATEAAISEFEKKAITFADMPYDLASAPPRATAMSEPATWTDEITLLFPAYQRSSGDGPYSPQLIAHVLLHRSND
jgi:hypothetical protein